MVPAVCVHTICLELDRLIRPLEGPTVARTPHWQRHVSKVLVGNDKKTAVS